MDSLVELAHALNPDEHKVFRASMKYGKIKTKEAVLYDAMRLREDWAKGELMSVVYKDATNISAYHRVRDRLRLKLVEFLAVRRIQKKMLNGSLSRQKLVAAGELLDRHYWTAADKLLKDALIEANEDHNCQLVRDILVLQLDFVHRLDLQIDDIKKQLEDNAKELADMDAVRVIAAETKLDGLEKKTLGIISDPEQVVNLVMDKFKMKRSLQKNAYFMLRLLEAIRVASLSAKQYIAYLPYLERKYHSLKEDKAFVGEHAWCEIYYIYMIAHARYRKLHFIQALELLDQLSDMLISQGLERHPLMPRIVAMRSSILCFTGKNDEAILMLEAALKSKVLRIHPSDLHDMQLNRIVYYFNQKSFRVAAEKMAVFGAGTKEMQTTKGAEFCLKSDMISIIIQYERQNMELVYARIEVVQKEYVNLLDKDFYRFAEIFLKMVLKMLNEPEEIKTEAFNNEVNELSNNWPAEKLDLQAICFLCWMKSKAKGTDYYESLVEFIRRRMAQQEGLEIGSTL